MIQMTIMLDDLLIYPKSLFGLKEHVTGKGGHTLQRVITKSNDSLVQNIRVCDPAISDHRAVHWGLLLEKPSCVC